MTGVQTCALPIYLETDEFQREHSHGDENPISSFREESLVQADIVEAPVSAQEKRRRDAERDEDHRKEKDVGKPSGQADIEVGKHEPQCDGQHGDNHHLLVRQRIEVVDRRAENKRHHRRLDNLDQKHHPL